MVRCKFICIGKVPCGVEGTGITLVPVNSGSEENKHFFSATPAGKIELGIVNQATAKRFDEGKEYYIDIAPAGE